MSIPNDDKGFEEQAPIEMLRMVALLSAATYTRSLANPTSTDVLKIADKFAKWIRTGAVPEDKPL